MGHMDYFLPRFTKTRLLEAALGIFLLHLPLSSGEETTSKEEPLGLLSPPVSRGEKALEKAEHNTPSLNDALLNKDAYTINFDNISMIEYIRFVSKITNQNFIFDEAELQFNVTIISEDPVTPRNIMSILIQILRSRNLSVLEQESNLLITSVKTINQIAKVVSSDISDEKENNSPLVTRVFRIKNANLNTVASIIKPMMSEDSLVEISAETKQLIVTDITTNVDKISALLASLDTPHTSLEIESYVAQNIDPAQLIGTAKQLLAPFEEGNPIIFVPQSGTKTIFIVSTPYLMERALTILEDLDTITESSGPASMQQLYIYKLQNTSGEDFLSALKRVSEELKTHGAARNFLETLGSAKFIPESRSVIFLGNQETLTRAKDLASTLDISGDSGATTVRTLFAQMGYVSSEKLQKNIDELADTLATAKDPDYKLIDGLRSRRFLEDKKLVVFTGDPQTLKTISETILPSLGISANTQDVGEKGVTNQFLIHNPKNMRGEDLKLALEEICKSLKSSNLEDPAFLQTLDSVKWVPSTNSLIFTGSPPTLQRLEGMLSTLDSTQQMKENGEGFYLYKLQYVSGDVVEENLKKVAEDLQESKLPNQKLFETIKTAKWVKANNSILLTGSSLSIEEAKSIIAQFDVSPDSDKFHKTEFFLFHPMYQTAQAIFEGLKELRKDLEASGLVDSNLMLTLNTMTYSPGKPYIVFTGTKEALASVKELIQPLDVISPRDAQIQQLGQQTFLIYKIKFAAPDQLAATLTKMAGDLSSKGVLDPSVKEALKSMQYIAETKSLIFVGSAETLHKVELMLKQFDTADLGPRPALPHNPETFVVYTPKYQTGEDLIALLHEFGDRLETSGVSKNNLLGTLRNVQWMPTTCSLIITGDAESIAKIEDLLKKFDVPNGDDKTALPAIESIDNTSFLIYKLQYHQGNEIVTALKQIGVDLGKAQNSSNQNLLSAINSLQCVNVTNSLLASGEAETLGKLKELIENLDIPLRQIFIEVLVLETSLTNTQNFGLQWGGKMNFMNRFGMATGNFPVSAAQGGTTYGTNSPNIGPSINALNPTPITTSSNGTPPPGIPFTSGFDLGVIGDIIMHKGKSFLSLGSLVNALQIDNDSQVILNPKIITQDNRTSTIFVGNNVPFVGSTSQISGAGSNNTTNVEYRDIGFNLTITPTIGNNDIVTLDISNDISEVIAPLQNSPGATTSTGVTGITSSHTTMSTRVHVPDQHFVVLTGMIQDTKTHFKSQIPCLGGIPVIGLAFSENDRLDNKQNVIIFVRPHIVNTYKEYKAITDRQEAQFKEQAVLPIMKEEIDAGIDLVKTPENE